MRTIDSLIVGCIMCDGTGWVCENHPHKPWAELSDVRNACECGAGMLCECSGYKTHKLREDILETKKPQSQ